jgi:hypothetical protein
MTAVMQSMITMARMGRSSVESPGPALLLREDDFISLESIVCPSPQEEDERLSPQ